MPDTITCPQCKGQGSYEALVSQHDDKKEVVKCEKCHGKGVIHQMTAEEESDYWADYW
jgi:DnaJ-class molecular chaperone